MKRCATCGVTKPYPDFHFLHRGPDGYYPECKTCRRMRYRVIARRGGSAGWSAVVRAERGWVR